MIDKLLVRGIKGFSNERTFEFESTNIITGETAAGKSTLIEALYILREMILGGNPFHEFWGASSIVSDKSSVATIEADLSINGEAISYHYEFLGIGYNPITNMEVIRFSDLLTIRMEDKTIYVSVAPKIFQSIYQRLNLCEHLRGVRIKVTDKGFVVEPQREITSIFGILGRTSLACVFENSALVIYDSTLPIASPIENRKPKISEIIDKLLAQMESSVVILGINFDKIIEPSSITKKPKLLLNASNLASYLLARYLEDDTLMLKVNRTLRKITGRDIKIKPYITDDRRAHFAVLIDGEEIPPPTSPKSILALATYIVAIHSCRGGFVAIDDIDAYLRPETITELLKEIDNNTQAFIVIRNQKQAQKIAEETNSKLITI